MPTITAVLLLWRPGQGKTFLQRMGIPPPKFQKLRATVDENLAEIEVPCLCLI